MMPLSSTLATLSWFLATLAIFLRVDTKRVHVLFEGLTGQRGPLFKELLDHDGGGYATDLKKDEDEEGVSIC